MQKANYITREGYLALDRELKYLWKKERPKVTQTVSDAAALGDRSENAEYIYGKRRLREIDRRVRFLTKRLETLTIVEPDPRQEGKVFFGAWVKLEDENGNLYVYRIVGADEFDPKKNWISINSPVARALIGHKVDDEITVITPNGKIFYYILEISYKELMP
ncbi:transcription elongation factor GreB [Gilliamella sp. App6-5]|jgi:transcription elongation factor GreB|uniref:transcription elongation factor GreB n=1 Tax=Gilliamella sp. App6-5 TaxID=3120232 RepID=UPI00080DFFB7|nr:transcription elongation factor GreB [Gilliamella apicola]OCG10072.1 transcription elongation factor GreB [Gilliamella apicola]